MGVLWSASVFIMGIVAMASTGYGMTFVHGMGTLYIGYAPTFIGSIIGAIWAFVDGFLGAAIFAWLYNIFAGKKCSCGTKES